MNQPEVNSFLNKYFKERPFFLGLFRAKELEILSRKLNNLPKGKTLRILDYGCGDGFFTKVLFESLDKELVENIELIGLEVEEDIVTETRKLTIYKDIVVFDSHKIPFEENSFDYVISNSVMEHVHFVDENIAEISRVMKKDAIFFCTIMVDTWWRENLFGTKLLGNIYRKWMKGMQYVAHSINYDEWQKKFTNKGLTTEELIGYLDPKTSMMLDLAHYISIESLFTKKLFNKWVIFPQLYDILPVSNFWSKRLANEIELEKASGIYFELKKQ